MSLEKFKAAGLTKTQSDGSERLYFHNAVDDTQGRRVYCVVARDMSLNELVPMTPKQMFMVQLKFGDFYTIEDWTETFNIQPDMLDAVEDHKYGVNNRKYTFEDLMYLGTESTV